MFRQSTIPDILGTSYGYRIEDPETGECLDIDGADTVEKSEAEMHDDMARLWEGDTDFT